MSVLLVLSCTPRQSDLPRPDPSAAASQESSSGTPQQTPEATRVVETRLANADNASRKLSPVVAHGTGNFVGLPSRVERVTTVNHDGDITLNFLNADVRDVVKAVLGDYLKLNYVVDNAVQGTVSIQTRQPLQRDQVLTALEQALRFSGVVMVSEGGLYRIVPASEAPRTGGMVHVLSDASPRPAGFRVEIVPLRYVSAQEMQRVLEPLAPKGAIMEVDTARNLLMLGGNEQELDAMRDDIEIFDVDWMAGMSFALYPLKAVDTKTIMGDLTEIMGGPRSPISGLVRLIPIDRMNAILVVSPQAKYLDSVRTWIRELDQTTESADQRIYIYYVQNGRALNLANSLTKLLGVGGGTSVAPASFHPNGDVPNTLMTPPPPGADQSPRSPDPTIPPLGAQLPPGAPGASAGTITPAINPQRDEGISVRGMADVHITADETNNALLILATPRQYDAIEAALQKLDIVPLQVLLEASIAEVTLTNELRYGVQYFLNGSRNQLVLTNTGSTAIAPTLPGFSYLFSSGAGIQVILDALESVTNVNVVSAPELLVLNNQTATLQVGNQVPIATQSAVSVSSPGAPVVNTIEFKDTGVILKVTPRVNEGGLVMLDINQEVSDTTRTTTSDLNSPTIETRKVSSSVAVKDGQTIALGGLIQDSKNVSKNGIPFLQNIPVVGQLFRNNDTTDTRTELLVLVTPHVIESLQKAHEVTDEIRRKMPVTKPVFDRAK